MRYTFVRAVVFSGGLLTLLAANSASDPLSPQPAPDEPVTWRGMYPNQPAPPTLPPPRSPDTGKLKADIDALRAERKDAGPSVSSDMTAERERLRARVNELLKRLESQAAPPDKPPVAPPPKPVKIDPTDPAKPVDAFQEAINRFRGSDFDGALRALGEVDYPQLSREDRAYAEYLRGCSLRRLNRLAEAATVFRDVANARDNDFVADAAVTQLALIRSTQELEALLEQLRARPKR